MQWDDKDIVQADMERFVEDGSLDDNVESFLSHDDTDLRDTVGRCMDVSKGKSHLIIVFNIGFSNELLFLFNLMLLFDIRVYFHGG